MKKSHGMLDHLDAAPITGARIMQIGLSRFADAPGGLTRSFDDTVSMFAANGYCVRALVCGEKEIEQLTSGRYAAFAPRSATTAQRVISAGRVIANEVASFRPAVVGSHFALYGAASPVALRKQPHIVHFHGPWSQEAAREGAEAISANLKYLLERYVYRRADLHIVLSSAFAEVLERSYGISPQTIRVVPGAVDTRRFKLFGSRNEARKTLGWPCDRPIVLAVRRLIHRVGLHNLITAAIELRRRRPDVLVIIVGDGPLKPKLLAQIEAADLTRHVLLAGYLPEDQLPTAYRAADVTVVPSEALEGFGLPTIESLACGTPVIVTPVGGLPEVVDKLQSELITPGSTADALSDTISRAVDGQISLPTPAQCSRYVLQNFSPEVIGCQLSAAYRELM